MTVQHQTLPEHQSPSPTQRRTSEEASARPQRKVRQRASGSATGTPSRARTVTLWVLQVVAALAFLLAALGKLTGAEQSVAAFAAIGIGDWFRYLVAALEIAGAVALLIPRLSGLAGLAFVGLMVGAVLTHLTVVGGGVVAPLPLLVLSALVAWGRRRSTAQLWESVARRRNAIES